MPTICPLCQAAYPEWSTAIPTKPGWYSWRFQPTDPPTPLEITTSGKCRTLLPGAGIFDYDPAVIYGQWYPIPLNMTPHNHWH